MRRGCDFRHFSLSELTLYPVTTAVLPNTRVCWDVMPCNWSSGFPRYGGTWCLQLQGKAVKGDLHGREDGGTAILRNIRS